MSDNDNRPAAPAHWAVELFGGGAAGVGIVLVFLPTLAIVLGAVFFRGSMIVGLPVLAILGIMILLGTLSLVAMLFKRLELADPLQPLALPAGSMRATIALSLIVLFAIFSITLYLSIANAGTPYTIGGLREAERNALVMATPSRVVLAEDDQCASQTREAACPPDDRRFKVTLRAASSSDGIDFAKQLLVLVGTLMTSVTSYYFATRAGAEASSLAGVDPASKTSTGQAGDGGSTGSANSSTSGGGNTATAAGATSGAGTGVGAAGSSVGSAAAGSMAETHTHGPDDADGCDVEILDATADMQLPPAVGGVAASAKGA